MKKRLLMLISFITIGAISCTEENLDIKNQGAYDSSNYFVSAAQINEALTANYAGLLQQGLFAREWYFIYDTMGNDAERSIALLGDGQQLTEFNHDPEHPQIKQMWQTLYRIVFRSNFVIDRAMAWQATSTVDKALKKQYIAEATFLRGWANFVLVNNWGRVPFRENFASSSNFNIGRASIADLWKSIETDFSKAATELPASFAGTDRGRATSGASTAMLGKAYLFQKKWGLAQTEFEKLTKGQYSLNPSYDEQFSATSNNNSKETVFDVPHRWSGWATGNQYYMFGGQDGWGGKTTHTGRAQEYGFNDWNNVFISNAAVQAFTYTDEAGKKYTDPRAKLVFYGDVASGGDVSYCDKCAKTIPYDFAANGYKWRKYEPYELQEKIDGPQSEINSQVIRYADVLLMLAESQIQQGNTTASLPLINQVRKRVGAFEYKSLGNQAEATAKLIRERQIELCGEQVRYFDLMRWGLFKNTINTEKNAVRNIYTTLRQNPVEDKHLLFPIPNSEKSVNPEVAKDVANGWN